MWKKRLLVLIALSSLAIGCGDAVETTAADLEGLWIVQSLTVMNGSTAETLTRDGAARAVRADVLITATGERTATFATRLAELVDRLLTREVPLDTQSVVVDGSKLVVTDGQSVVTVFDYVLAGDELSLTWNADDVRNTVVEPPVSVELVRIPNWGIRSVGAWDIVSLTSTAGGTFMPDACQEAAPGVWATNAMTVEITDRHLFERVANLRTFSDSACTVPDQSGVDVQVGMAEEDGGTLRLWTFSSQDPGSSEYFDFTMTVSSDEMTLVRNSCLPVATCTDNGPTEVVIRKTD